MTSWPGPESSRVRISSLKNWGTDVARLRSLGRSQMAEATPTGEMRCEEVTGEGEAREV